MILIIINILQLFPDDDYLHGHQTGCLYGHRHHSPAHLCCTQSVPHHQERCSNHEMLWPRTEFNVVFLILQTKNAYLRKKSK